jgi:hypothetical protein
MSIAFLEDTSVGGRMTKLNTHAIYDLAIHVHALIEINHTEEMQLGNIFWRLLNAKIRLQSFSGEKSLFSPSLKRAASALLGSIHSLGISEKFPWEEGGQSDFNLKIGEYQVTNLVQSVKDFEIVLANELPGLDTYHVSPIGIYSTPALIEHAELAILEGLSEDCQAVVSENAKRDFNQAGRCLAFELATAAGFHTMRSVEAVLRGYWALLKKPASGTKLPEMAQCINELRASGEDPKLMDILDHIRDLHRNTLMHPEAFLQMTEALRLFDIAKSAISAMAERMHVLTVAVVPASSVPLNALCTITR